MKPFDLPKISLNKKSSFLKELKPPRTEFPKIEKAERLEKQKKKEEEKKKESIFAPPSKMENLSIQEVNGLSALKSISQMANIVVSKIKMVKKTGQIKTNFIINTKAFGEVEIVVKLYDTNPYTYHVTLLGNQKLQQEAIKHQNAMSNEINKSLSNIKVHITPPALRRKDRFEGKKKKGIEKSKDSCYGEFKRLVK